MYTLYSEKNNKNIDINFNTYSVESYKNGIRTC
jgi:hypothetical protein